MNWSKIIPLLIPVIILQLILIVVGLVNISHKTKTKFLNKIIWILIIIFINIIGPTIYFIIEGKEEDEGSN